MFGADHIFHGLQPGGYAAIAIDPPWRFQTRTAAGEGRCPQAHYETMSMATIRALPIGELAADDAFLFLWTTGPHLPFAIDCMAAWGFAFSGTAFTWAKLKRSAGAMFHEGSFHIGMGYSTRKNCEFCLLGRRGSPKRKSKAVRELIVSPVREHSRKPDEAYERIEQLCDGPYLDLFSREARPNWTGWGLERTRFNQLEGV